MTYDCVIIGAGQAGLCLASFLTKKYHCSYIRKR